MPAALRSRLPQGHPIVGAERSRRALVSGDAGSDRAVEQREGAHEGVEELFIDGGFAEMVHDKLTILTEDAKRPEELDREQAIEERTEAAGTVAVSEEAFSERQRALKRARTQLRMLEG